MLQESCRKDVEMAFGVLQQRWQIISRPSNLWLQKDMKTTITACIILHNMIVEDQQGDISDNFQDIENRPCFRSDTGDIRHFICAMKNFQDRDQHHNLRLKIMDHQWLEKGNK